MSIHSKASTPEYAEGHDRIFGKNKLVKNDEFAEKRKLALLKLERITQEHLGQSNICLTSSFEALGADSLDQVELLMEVEYVFHIELSDAVALKFKTVGDVLEYLVTHSKVY